MCVCCFHSSSFEDKSGPSELGGSGNAPLRQSTCPPPSAKRALPPFVFTVMYFLHFFLPQFSNSYHNHPGLGLHALPRLNSKVLQLSKSLSLPSENPQLQSQVGSKIVPARHVRLDSLGRRTLLDKVQSWEMAKWRMGMKRLTHSGRFPNSELPMLCFP